MTVLLALLWLAGCGITVCAFALLLALGFGAVNGYADWLDRREVARIERQTWGVGLLTRDANGDPSDMTWPRPLVVEHPDGTGSAVEWTRDSEGHYRCDIPGSAKPGRTTYRERR